MRDAITTPDSTTSRPTLTVLGFDYGARRIGVAVGNTFTRDARALSVVGNGDNGVDWPRVESVVRDWRPNALLVGLPLMLDGSEQANSKGARTFAEALGERYKLPVHMVDERLEFGRSLAPLRRTPRERTDAPQERQRTRCDRRRGDRRNLALVAVSEYHSKSARTENCAICLRSMDCRRARSRRCSIAPNRCASKRTAARIRSTSCTAAPSSTCFSNRRRARARRSISPRNGSARMSSTSTSPVRRRPKANRCSTPSTPSKRCIAMRSSCATRNPARRNSSPKTCAAMRACSTPATAITRIRRKVCSMR